MQKENLPKGWEITKFTDYLDIQGGTQPPKSHFIDNEKSGYIRLLQIRDFGSKPVPTYIPNKKTLKTCKREDVLIARYGASIGRVCTGMEGAYNVALAKVIKPTEFSINYIKHYLSSSLFQNPLQFISRSAQSGFNKDDLKDFIFPIPPTAEQTQIATLLDDLLARVQAIQTRLNKIPELLKQFRQSVLADAVSGRLTEKWREENGIAFEWEETFLENFIHTSSNGISKRKSEQGKEITVLRLADFKNSIRIHGNERKIKLNEKELEKYLLLEDDILVVRVNGSVDLAGKFTKYICINEPECFCDHFIRLRLDKKLNADFLLYVANEGIGREYLKNCLVTSAGQNTINQNAIKKLRIRLPLLKEQTQIVSIVENYLTLADTIETQTQQALEKVNLLTQSILAKAFRGELTEKWRAENQALISGENSAKALLAKIEAELQAVKKRK